MGEGDNVDMDISLMDWCFLIQTDLLSFELFLFYNLWEDQNSLPTTEQIGKEKFNIWSICWQDFYIAFFTYIIVTCLKSSFYLMRRTEFLTEKRKENRLRKY